jgi:hypothetical protein
MCVALSWRPRRCPETIALRQHATIQKNLEIQRAL